MNKASYGEIKSDAKLRMSGHFGEAFLALLVLPLAFGTGRSIILLFFTNAQILGQIVNFLIVVLILYITLNLALKFSRSEYSSLFVNIFGNSNTYLNLLILSLITSAILVFPMFLFADYIADIATYFTSMPTDYMPTEDEFNTIIWDFMPSTQLLYTSLVLIIISFIIRIKLYLAAYLIIDRNMNAIDAIKLSWDYTNGNFFRIFFFPLSFILWFLLFFVTCGLIMIYLIPYMSIAYASLYNSILKENDDYIEDDEVKEILKPNDPLREEKKNDPFDDYYE